MLEPRNIRSRYARLVAACAVLAVCTALFVGGAQPFAVNLIPSPWDKFAHCTVFAVVGAAFAVLANARRWPLVVAAAAVATLLGALDEWHQLTLPGRNGGWEDLAADAAGALVGAYLTSTRSRR